MKFTALTVVAVALCLAGCKYDKINEGDIANDTTNITDIEGLTDGNQTGTIGSLTEGKFEDLYTRCTDVSFDAVYFGFDSTTLGAAELGKIEAVARHLTDKSDRVVVIEGNCDERGSNEYNMGLGENRAIVIRTYLMNNGITEDRIQVRSYGSERPAVLGHDESAWAKNRRGEFAIFQK